MEHLKPVERIDAERASQLLLDGWVVDGLVEENGRVRATLRNPAYPEVVIVDEPDPAELPHAWPA